MKKSFKKFLTAILAAVFAINFVPVGPNVANAVTSTTTTKAYLSLVNSDSSVMYNGATDAKNIGIGSLLIGLR